MPIQSSEYQVPQEYLEQNQILSSEIDPVIISNVDEAYSNMPDAAKYAQELSVLDQRRYDSRYAPEKNIIPSPQSLELLRVGNSIAEARTYELQTKFFDRDDSMGIIKAAWRKLISPSNKSANRGKLREVTEERLINKESLAGVRLFEKTDERMNVLGFHVEGPDSREWYLHFYYQEDKKTFDVTWHYSVLDDKVLKAITVTDPKQPEDRVRVDFRIAEPQDVDNLVRVAGMYVNTVLPEVYNRDPNTGRLLDQLI